MQASNALMIFSNFALTGPVVVVVTAAGVLGGNRVSSDVTPVVKNVRGKSLSVRLIALALASSCAPDVPLENHAAMPPAKDATRTTATTAYAAARRRWRTTSPPWAPTTLLSWS